MTDALLKAALNELLTRREPVKLCPQCLALLPISDMQHRHYGQSEAWPEMVSVKNRASTYVVE